MKNLSIDDVVAQLNAAVIRAGGIADWAKGIEAPSVVKVGIASPFCRRLDEFSKRSGCNVLSFTDVRR